MFTLSMFHYLQILRTHLKELRYLAYIFGLGTTIMLMTPSCKPKVTLSTPTEGHILVGVDQELMSLMVQMEDIFERNYNHAQVDLQAFEETDLINTFLKDSLQYIVTSRDLNQKELDYFKKLEIVPRRYSLGTSALAFVVNKANLRDTALTYEKLLEFICIKPLSDFKQLVIENTRSGIAHVLLDKCQSENLPSHIYAKKSKSEVFDYVEAHPEAIGLVDWSALSDSDDPVAKKELSRVRLLAVSRPMDSVQQGFVLPYQYNLQDKIYPFTRDLYIISRSGRNDLGLGFASFMAGEIGQKILLKAGLLPKYQSERWIEIKSKNLDVVE